MASSLNTTYPLLSRIIAAAVNISQRSANILRDVKKSGELNIKEKQVDDYVTKADFLSQLNIVRSLEKLFPKLKICGEEGDLKDEYKDLELTFNDNVLKVAQKLPDIYSKLNEEDLIVWVDPLDGTKEYTLGPEVSHEVTVLIGVAWNGKPIAGVVNQPFANHLKDAEYLSRVLWGIEGLGTFDLEKGKLSVPSKPDPNATTIVTTRSHMTDLVRKDLGNFPNSKIIHCGGAGYKVLCVIDGKADCYLYPRDGTKRWDTCAPEALLRSLGGSITDVYNNEYSYLKNDQTLVENCFGIIASLNKENSFYTSKLSEELKSNVKQAAQLLESKLKP